ncbi:MAG: arginase family protein [Candidatus Aenigmarchaeota archaeon]|nr:arginase family protein [Candidatus Aenigmarchaeota archaeon]
MEHLNKATTRMTFLDDECNPSFDKADVVCFGVAFDHTASYHKGAWFGPLAVLNASYQIEYEVPHFGVNLSEVVKINNAGILEYPNHGIHELPEKRILELCRQMVAEVEELSGQILKAKKKIMMFGGEHSVSNGVFKAISEVHKPSEVAVLHFDAHLDLRDALHDNKFSHGSVLRRCKDLGFPTIHVGIRDHISIEEREFIQKTNLTDSIYFCATSPRQFYEDVGAKENLIFDGQLSSLQRTAICKKISAKKLYITIDVDGLDPSEMPATGTPLPHGLKLMAVKELLYDVIKHCRKNNIEILGFDINEVSPLFRHQPDDKYEIENVIDARTEQNAALLAYFIVFWMYQERFKKK